MSLNNRARAGMLRESLGGRGVGGEIGGLASSR